MRATIVPPVLRNQSNLMAPGRNPSSLERSNPLDGTSRVPVRSLTGRLIVNVPGFGLAGSASQLASMVPRMGQQVGRRRRHAWWGGRDDGLRRYCGRTRPLGRGRAARRDGQEDSRAERRIVRAQSGSMVASDDPLWRRSVMGQTPTHTEGYARYCFRQ